MEFRPATPADAAALAAMNGQLIHDEGHRNPMSLAELEARMSGWLAGEYQAVVFHTPSGPAGYALYRHEPEYVYLRQFFVHPECRRTGIGRAAITWLREHCWKGTRVRVEVLVGNDPGLAFWRAVGFRDYCLALEFTC
ncbi:MAG TPA: GNAT family N-acetyltransferase [Urbifossiella sp.]|jgi:GNAT superfamily N-acetyltransferase|nr:GNAT family N-acetyltransferase [Urbifossiella sp.]